MAADSKPTLARAVPETSRRAYRDLTPVPARPPVDRVRVLAHLRAQLAEFQGTEVAHGDV